MKTVFERSKIPLTKWLAALFLMTASKKGVSAHQVHRMLGVSYKSTWFMMHRLREAMRTGGLEPLGGAARSWKPTKPISATPTTMHVSPQRKVAVPIQSAARSCNKRPIVALVERGGQRSLIPSCRCRCETVCKIVRENIDRETACIPTKASSITASAKEFAAHETVSTTATNMFAAT